MSCQDSIKQSLYEVVDHTEASTWDIPDYSFVLDLNSGSSEVYRVLGLHNLSLQLWTNLREDIEDLVACRPSDFFDMLHCAILSPEFVQTLMLSSLFYKGLASSELHRLMRNPDYCFDVLCISSGKLVEYSGSQALDEWFNSNMRSFAILARKTYDQWQAASRRRLLAAGLPPRPQSCLNCVMPESLPLSTRIEPEQAYRRRSQLLRTSKSQSHSSPSRHASPQARKIKSPLSRSSTQTTSQSKKENANAITKASQVKPRRVSRFEANSPLFRGAVRSVFGHLMTPPNTPYNARPSLR